MFMFIHKQCKIGCNFIIFHFLCLLPMFSEQTSAYVACVGSLLSVAIVWLTVPRHTKRAKVEGKHIQ